MTTAGTPWCAISFPATASHSPLFLEIPREFLSCLQSAPNHAADDSPFLQELAHYEWVELALSVRGPHRPRKPSIPAGDLLTGIPVLSPLAWPLAYEYPVHESARTSNPTPPTRSPPD